MMEKYISEKMAAAVSAALDCPETRNFAEELGKINWKAVSDEVAGVLRAAYTCATEESDSRFAGCLLCMSGNMENGFRCSEICFAEDEDDPLYEMGPVAGNAHFLVSGPAKALNQARGLYFDYDFNLYHLVFEAAMWSFAKAVHKAAEVAKGSEPFLKLNKTTSFKVAIVFHDSWGSDIENDEGLVWKG